MNKLDNPRFRYYTKAESEQPGYLARRMAFYKEMVKHEQDGKIHPQQENACLNSGDSRPIYVQSINGQKNAQLVMVTGKG